MLKSTAGAQVDVLKSTVDLVRVGRDDLLRSQLGADGGPGEGDEMTGPTGMITVGASPRAVPPKKPRTVP